MQKTTWALIREGPLGFLNCEEKACSARAKKMSQNNGLGELAGEIDYKNTCLFKKSLIRNMPLKVPGKKTKNQAS